MSEYGRKVIEKWEIFVISLLIILMIALGNPLKWVVSLIILGWFGLNMINHIYNKTDDMELWKRENELDEIVHLHISRLSDITEKAYEGKELSRGLLEEYLIDEFIKKIKDKRNLTNSEVKYLLDHPTDLKKVIEDDELTNFVLKGKSLKKVLQNEPDDDSKEKFFERRKIDKAYKRKIERLVKKMEEWN
ncbi:MAG: hypothetical protein R6W73_02000 [Candidatus Saliniplasma sp.]